MQAIDDCQRSLNGQRLAVGQLSPHGFIIGFDGGPVFGERQFEAHKGIRVTVGKVMHDLPYGPAAFAIGRIELRIAEPADGGTQPLGQQTQGLDVRGARLGTA